jgi:hypothetical protein
MVKVLMSYLLQLLLLCSGVLADIPTIDLPALGALSDQTTISGFSSGAYMAHMMHITYSDYFKGAGIVTGGPFWCAQDSFERMMLDCSKQTFNRNMVSLQK